jgi:hypothetical protein
MNELDDLRAVLRARADLTPDPDALLPAIHEQVRGRRTRLRTAALAGVVVATVGGLAAASLIHFGPANSAATPQLRASLPFTVGHVPAGYQMLSWRTESGEFSEVDYQSGTTSAINVEEAPNDFASAQGRRTTVHGVPAVLNESPTTGPKGEQLVWSAGPGRSLSVSVSEGVSESILYAVADSVTTTPSEPPSMILIRTVPAGLTLEAWVSVWNPRSEQVTLCPPATPYTSGQPVPAPTQPPVNPCLILNMITFHSTVATQAPDGQGHLVNGRFLMAAQIDPEHQLSITAPANYADEARALFEAVSPN